MEIHKLIKKTRTVRRYDESSLLGEKNDIRYWRDEKGVHHVPKRGLDDIILSINLPSIE